MKRASVVTALETNAVHRMELAVAELVIPVVIVRGRGDGPVLGVTAGIHGSEYNSLGTAFSLIDEIPPEHLAGTLVVLPLVNIPAFENRSVYVCPLDQKNINRSFPGKTDGTASEQIAAEVFSFVTSTCQCLVDLHCGDLIEDLGAYASYIFTDNAKIDEQMAEMAELMNLGAVLANRAGFPGTLAGEAAKSGVPSIVAECGGRGVLDSGCVRSLGDGVKNIMKRLKMLPGEAAEAQLVEVYHSFSVVNAALSGVLLPLRKPGEHVPKDEPLAVVRDYAGRVLQIILSPAEGKILLFTGPPIRAEEMAAVILL